MIPAAFLILVVVAYRVAFGMMGSNDSGWLHNFAPVAAIALCGAVCLPKRMALALPLGALLVSDIILNVFHYHQPLFTWEIVPRYLALGLISEVGFLMRNRVRFTGLVTGSVAGSLIFYVVTNTGSWIGDPAYAKSFAGWIQAMTVGVPGYPPTWWFYRHTLMSDMLFTALFAACIWFPSGQRAMQLETRRATV
jgi:hypothetical protein